MVLCVIGQMYVVELVGCFIELQGGCIKIDEQYCISVDCVWVGGDCCFGGCDLMVEVVEYGKCVVEFIYVCLMEVVYG